MVSTQKKEVFRELHLEGEQKTNSCNTEVTSINVVAQEEVVCLWREASAIEMVEQILELAVNVSQYIDRWYQFEKYWLLFEDVFCCHDQKPDLLFF